METYVQSYEIDIYAWICVPNYKVLILKNETKTNNLGVKTTDIHLQDLFKKI